MKIALMTALAIAALWLAFYLFFLFCWSIEMALFVTTGTRLP